MQCHSHRLSQGFSLSQTAPVFPESDGMSGGLTAATSQQHKTGPRPLLRELGLKLLRGTMEPHDLLARWHSWVRKAPMGLGGGVQSPLVVGTSPQSSTRLSRVRCGKICPEMGGPAAPRLLLLAAGGAAGNSWEGPGPEAESGQAWEASDLAACLGGVASVVQQGGCRSALGPRHARTHMHTRVETEGVTSGHTGPGAEQRLLRVCVRVCLCVLWGGDMMEFGDWPG